jgi:mannose-1-phosphate guanylyltransferase
VRAALPHLGSGPVIVANADILVAPNYADLLASCDSNSCSFCVSRLPIGLGTLGVDEEGRVVRMRGEVFGDEVTGADYVGVAALGAGVIESLPRTGCLIGDWALPRLRRAETIRAHFDPGTWTDIGEIRTYVGANWAWLSARKVTAWMAADSRVSAGASLTNAIIGSGASVETKGPLNRVIVWPGALVTSPMNDCIVMAGGQIVSIRA